MIIVETCLRIWTANTCIAFEQIFVFPLLMLIFFFYTVYHSYVFFFLGVDTDELHSHEENCEEVVEFLISVDETLVEE